MDHDQQPRAPRLDDLLTLCQQMAALEPDQITAAMLEEMASLTLLHAVGIVHTMRVPLVVLDATLHVLLANRSFYGCVPPFTQSSDTIVSIYH